jgi:gamma-glutamyl hercynylcysteine S-oxide synthase
MYDTAADLHDAHSMRRAGRELLSLALMDARNHTLQLFSAFETAGKANARVPGDAESPLWLLGHVAWFQEAWIARNMQRARGTACDPRVPQLASIEPNADRWYGAHADAAELPSAAAVRSYLVETLETTTELLSGADEDDDALYFYRLALFHEDLLAERWCVMAQAMGVPLGRLQADAVARAAREPLLVPATRFRMGSERSGFVWDNEKWAHDVAVPPFEIDAQPVTWAQFVEFVEDGGYDDERWWTAAAWEWVQHEQRRAPRYVEQMRGRVAQQRFGRMVHASAAQSAVHVSWYEADAWCRWAGRRLPTEVEWELCACTLASRGFRHGDVWEWTASTFNPYPGFAPDPWREYSQPRFGAGKSLRGGSWATRERFKHPRMRAFAAPHSDAVFVGFRSCAP